MSLQLEVPALGLPEEEAQRRFEQLQDKLVPLWRLIEDLEDYGEQTVVVVPSLTVEYAALQGSLLQAYEERFLFLLLLLRQPRARLIYITSQPIHPNIVEYYLGLLPGVIASHARSRLHLLAPCDGASQPLSMKLLQRPRMLGKIRSLIPDPNRAHLIPFNTTKYERDLALRLGIPMYGADPKHLHYGTKSGCRKLFRESGVSLPAGFEDLSSLSDVVEAVQRLKAEHPNLNKAMVKHNDGVSGDGNATVDVRGVDGHDRAAVERAIREMKLESKSMGFEAYFERLSRVGGVVEERVQGDAIVSPSVQMRVTPLGEAELLSTHDQLLGGGGDTFMGCVFPADPAYAAQIAWEASKVGDRLAKARVLGRFGIDFVCAKGASGWRACAIELNLRKGGTTHPFLTLQFLTDGRYDPERAVFIAGGCEKHYVATDGLSSHSYRALTPDDVFDIAVRHGLHFDQTRQTGVVFHMLSAIGDGGRLGLTAVGNSPADAKALYDKTQSVLDAEASLATLHEPLGVH